MARIVTMCHTKGGVGKSTLTYCFAGDFALRGYRVAVVDTDEQRSVFRSAQKAPPELQFPAHVEPLFGGDGVRLGRVSDALKQLDPNYDVIFVDVQGRASSPELSASIAGSDLVVGVCVPKPLEVDAMDDLLRVLTRLEEDLSITPVVRLLINNIEKSRLTRVEKFELARLLDLPMERFSTVLRHKISIAEALSSGLLPHDLEKNNGAADAVGELGEFSHELAEAVGLEIRPLTLRVAKQGKRKDESASRETVAEPTVMMSRTEVARVRDAVG